jgi:hypothetical protein
MKDFISKTTQKKSGGEAEKIFDPPGRTFEASRSFSQKERVGNPDLKRSLWPFETTNHFSKSPKQCSFSKIVKVRLRTRPDFFQTGQETDRD